MRSHFADKLVDMYGCGRNEELLGKILKTQRDKVFVCTKFGNVRGPNGEFLGVDGKPEYVRQQCDISLKRLGINYIDLYYQHRVDPNTPIEETIGAMAELVKQGKVKYLGMSECSAETLRRAYKVHPIAAVQMEYSPWTLDIERNGLLDAAKELGVTIVAYSPLGRGFLTGAYKKPEDFEEGDFRRYNPRFQGEAFNKNLELVKKLEELAAKKNVTPSELTLAWVIAQGFIAIPGTKKIKYLDSNFSADKIQLTSEELQQIRSISEAAEIIGTRYAQDHLKTVNL
jgi:aryl-alcohol dehydrogenase-like predicted oxidoreductase